MMPKEEQFFPLFKQHADRLATRGRLVGGQDFVGLHAVGGGPGQLPGAVAGRLIEALAEPVPLCAFMLARSSVSGVQVVVPPVQGDG